MLRLLASRWVLSLVGTALLAALLFVFGPLWPPLEPVLPRLIAVQTMLMIWGAVNGALTWRRRAQDTSFASGVAGKGLAQEEEAEAVAGKLKAALDLFKRTGKGRILRQLPFYVIIGPPGAGKTTALLNAGLRFPLAEQLGSASVAGVGGTRLCDWWFTDDAVLIDTAGRYTTQDSDTAVDRAGWEAFLGLLRRTRPRQALNGAIVAIALPTVVGSAAEAAEHAAAISRRIAELESRLGLRLPIYALFTKTDLVAGFSEFFDDLDRDGRDQVWGMTFPFGKKAAGGAEQFPPGFRALLAGLMARVTPRLQAERRPDRRGPIAGFPAQFGSLEKPLAAFLNSAFAPFGGKAPPMLRGVYFTSGTQEGTPFDRLGAAMARTFGIEQRRPAALRPDSGRSYFLGRLLRDVVFGEAMLVQESPAARRRRRYLAATGVGVVLLAVLVAGGVLFTAYTQAEAQTDSAAMRLASYEQTARALPLDPVSDGDLRPIATMLDKAAALDASQPVIGWPERLGLSQVGKLQAGERTVYRDGLTFGLLPRLIWRLEAAIRGSLDRPDRLYDLTRTYLMLGGAGPLDKEQLRTWMAGDWAASYPAEEDAPLRDSLARHFDALLAQPLPSVPLDGALVAAARLVLSRTPAADRIYTTVRNSAAAVHLPVWRPSDALGAAGAAIFVRGSGRKMTDGIPGFFSAEGFRTVLQPAVDAATRAAAGEAWVLGGTGVVSPDEARNLSVAIAARYAAEFGHAWDAMLSDLDVRPLQSLVQGAQDLYVLASPESPLRALLGSLAQQLALTAPQGSPIATLAARYAPLIAAAPGPAGSTLDASFRQLAEMQQQFAKLAALPIGTSLPPGGETIAAGLSAEAAKQPPPISRWLATIAASATALRTGNVRGQAAAIYNAPGGPAEVCQATMNGRYPFASPTAADLPIEQFQRLFQPGGMLDGFFNLQLKPFTDMSTHPWKPQPANNVEPPVDAADLQMFERAEAIRDVFFAGGGAYPMAQFDLQPLAFSNADSMVRLDAGGTVVTGVHGPSHATQITWPPPAGAPASLTFLPSGMQISESGPWALLRLFGHAKLQPGREAGHFTATFTLPGNQATFDVHAGSANNPFTTGLLSEFRCPAIK